MKIHSIFKYADSFPIISELKGAVNIAMQYHIKSEIIGQWLYCFTTELLGLQLKAIGFWYSKKHCAYVYSGYPKEGIADDESLDEIRSRLGSKQIKE